MATDDGTVIVSSNGLAAEPLHGLPVVGRKPSAEDVVASPAEYASVCPGTPSAGQGSSPNGHSHNPENMCHDSVPMLSGDDLPSLKASNSVHKLGGPSPVQHCPPASPPTCKDPTSRLQAADGCKTAEPPEDKREAITGVPDCVLRLVEDGHRGSVPASSHSNGVLPRPGEAAVSKMKFPASPDTLLTHPGAADPSELGVSCEEPPRPTGDSNVDDATCRQPVTSPVSAHEGVKVLPSSDEKDMQMHLNGEACGGGGSGAKPSGHSSSVVATCTKHSAVPNGDVSVRCIRDSSRGGSAGAGGRTVVPAPAGVLLGGRRRSASDGAVQENGWQRRGRSSHSECNGLDRRVIVLSSSGSSSGSTEGPDSPQPGEERGSGVRWTGGGRSVSEVKELAYARLQAELSRAQQELRLRDEEVARLSQIRDQVGAELEELTASLFEEANNMVREANMKQAAAEKRLQEATLKVEVLQAEVSALKALVLTSTPSRPNAHLHPQLSRHRHRRSPSNYELATCRPPSPPQAPQQQQPQLGQPQPGQASSDGSGPDLSEVDPVCHREFVRWQEKPRVDDREDLFVARLYQEDVLPCLHFPNSQLAAQVLRAIEENSITIEAVTAANPFPRRCSLLEASRVCQYRMRLGDAGAPWHHISQLCRNRITSVCDLFCYLRYIQQGLVRSSLQEMYWEVMRRRRCVALARLGLPSC